MPRGEAKHPMMEPTFWTSKRALPRGAVAVLAMCAAGGCGGARQDWVAAEPRQPSGSARDRAEELAEQEREEELAERPFRRPVLTLGEGTTWDSTTPETTTTTPPPSQTIVLVPAYGVVPAYGAYYPGYPGYGVGSWPGSLPPSVTPPVAPAPPGPSAPTVPPSYGPAFPFQAAPGDPWKPAR